MEPPLPKNILDILNAPCSFWPDKKVQETHLLVLIPNTVNEKPFTLNYLKELIKKPKSGYATKYKSYLPCIRNKLGDMSYPSHWVLMTKDVIHGKRNKLYSKCFNIIADHSKKTGIPYELPHELDAATSILMHYVKTGEKLYKRHPWSYTYSQNVATKEGDPAGVGGFDNNGLSIGFTFRQHIGNGIAAARRF